MLYLIPTFLISFIVPILVRFFLIRTYSIKTASRYTFKYPKFLTVVFLVPIVMIGGALIWAYLSNRQAALALHIVLAVFYTIFMTALIWAFLRTLSFQLTLEDDCIIYRNLLGRIKRIEYNEITAIKTYKDRFQNTIKFKIYIDNHSIEINHFMVNFRDFPKIMKRQLRKNKSPVQF